MKVEIRANSVSIPVEQSIGIDENKIKNLPQEIIIRKSMNSGIPQVRKVDKNG